MLTKNDIEEFNTILDKDNTNDDEQNDRVNMLNINEDTKNINNLINDNENEK